MGLYSGSMTGKQFFYYDDLPVNPFQFTAKFRESIEEHRICPIEVKENVRVGASGWCHPTNGSREFEVDEYAVDQGFVLGYRVDEKKIPATTLRFCLNSAIEAMKEGSGETKPRLPKKVRDAVREQLTDELMRHALPTTKMFEVYFNTNDKVITLFASSRAVHDKFRATFRDTFGFPIFARNAGTLCVQEAANADALEPYFDIIPATFVAGGQ